ncbi:hypothetical protein E4U14_000865, partial [Claviceps sp. LM454 group G7]
MAISTMLMIAISAAVLSTVQGQQFDGYTFPHDLLGLSDGCFATVNKTISSCPAWLPRGAAVEILPSEQLPTLCESSCRNDLQSLRASILQACTASSDIMTECFDSASASGKYCDAVVADWANQPNYTSAQTCSQCELGVQQLQLASPFGFSDTLAQAFANTTQSCSAADYKFATPTSYALNATQFPSQPPACTGTAYTITQDDS